MKHNKIMTRNRADSLVTSIAAHSNGIDSQFLPGILDDAYLVEKLQELSTRLGDREAHQAPILESAAIIPDPYAKYTLFSERLGSHIHEYENIISQSQKVNNELEEAIKMFHDISTNTKTFVNKTKGMYDEYTRLSLLHEQIPRILEYFDALDPIMRRLNHASTSNVVRKNSFKNMMGNIDASLCFLEEHEDLKDAASYRIRFKRCLIKACELISSYLNHILKQLYVEINEKLMSSIGSSSASKEALLYNKFASLAEEYRGQVIEIISRVNKDRYQRYRDELGSILNDCYETYFQTRMRLLHPSIYQRLNEITLQDKKLLLINFIQDGKTYFQQLCNDEYQLFIKFFPESESKWKINLWFVQLCEPVYDCVRVRVLRESDISTLCDALTLFGQYYEFEEESEEYQKQFSQIRYDKVFEPIVQGLQTTLILRVQVYVHQNIVKYTPTKDSFIIANRKSSLNDLRSSKEKEDPMVISFMKSFQDQLGADNVESLESYYPPLVRGLALLSRIYEMINSVVFDDLAHHIVHDCMLSLKTAYNKVQHSTNDLNNFEVKLAYLKNLLMLRQQLQNFNIQYSVNETYLDFSGMETFFKSVTAGARSLRFRDSSVLSLAKGLVPKVVNNLVDARSELMLDLRNIIKDFTEAAAKSVIQNTLIIDNKGDDSTLIQKNMLLRQNVEDKFPRIYAEICIYVKDKEVVSHLIDAVQEIIIESYRSFYEEVSEKAQSGQLDKVQSSEVMYDDVFAEFLSSVTGKLSSSSKDL
ncbi:COG3 (YER157W) [Zygosaccharomyces parabailii]|nr:COG3 (YER157W) [Zygosaccharomyces parabailii]